MKKSVITKIKYNKYILKGVPFELEFQFLGKLENPYLEQSNELTVKMPSNRIINIPLFWKGKNIYAARICTSEIGEHYFSFKSDKNIINQLRDYNGSFIVRNYEGNNPLFFHGAIKISENKKYFCHLDGKPFFWLADTWWFGATIRCRWPNNFQLLVQDRIKKGFSVVQMVIGIPPEVSEDDPAVSNEGGHPFIRKWDLINPNYFEFVDKRIEYLCNAGIVPCILGGWGYQIDWMGEEFMSKYWNYLVARYSAYPVVWCLCGELERKQVVFSQENKKKIVLLDFLKGIFYGFPATIRDNLWKIHLNLKKVIPFYWIYLHNRRKKWIRLGRDVSNKDPVGHLITAHPITYVYSHRSLKNEKWVSFTSIQSGHSHANRYFMVNAILKARRKYPYLPVLNMEPWYEGIGNSFWEKDQRYAFWMSILAGACGYSYGAHGVWQMDVGNNFLAHWGKANWKFAFQYPGAKQLGISKRFLEQYEWWKIEPQFHMIRPHWSKLNQQMPMMGSIEKNVFFIYFSNLSNNILVTLFDIPNRDLYRIFWLNPRNGYEINIIDYKIFNKGYWQVPSRPDKLDWVLILQKQNHYYNFGM